MSRKIIGVTVGTTMNPQSIIEKLNGATALPPITEEDNGKVLKVQNGQWSIGEDETSDALSDLEIEELLNKFATKDDLDKSKTTVVDNLTSTSTTSALSANQGKVLNDKFDSLDEMLENLATEKYVDDAIAVEEEARKKDVNRAISRIPDVSVFATHIELEEAIREAKFDIPIFPELTDYATKEYVDSEINIALGSKEDLSWVASKEYVDEEVQEVKDLIPNKYVESVNGYSGEVTLAAADVHALPDSTIIPTVPNVVSAFTNDADYASKTYVSEIASGKCQAYTFDTIDDLDTWLTNTENTANLNSGDIFYIRAVGVPDYWWDKETQSKCILETTKVELDDYAKTVDIPTKTSQLTNDTGYTTISEVDTKLGGKQDKLSQYVSSVNGKSGAVSLNCSDVGAMPADTPIPTVPTKVSAFENDKGYLTTHQDLSAYAKKTDIPSIPSSLPANGGNADTVDGMHIRIGTSGADGSITFVV